MMSREVKIKHYYKDKIMLKNSNWIKAAKVGESECPLFFKKFLVKEGMVSATVLSTAIGIYELYVNGKKVSDSYFAPGWTSYHNRIQYQSYDITELLHAGENDIAILSAAGWAVGYIGRGNTNRMLA